MISCWLKTKPEIARSDYLAQIPMTESTSSSTFEELQKLFNTGLEQEIFPDHPAQLYDPVRYIFSLGGKRIRPVLTLMGCEMFGSPPQRAMPQAMAIELFHNFTLIHDDIMDHAPIRRGQKTIHEKFGQASAILSGDVMLVFACQYLVRCESTITGKLITAFNDCAIKVCEGQQLDMNFESTFDIGVDEYIRMIELKTATLVATALKIGALVSGAADEDANHLYEFGRHIGIAFQLKDDWLDSFGAVDKFGKQKSGDIIQNKKTFLMLKAMNLADHATRIELKEWYSKKDSEPAQKVEAVNLIFNRLKISSHVEDEMKIHMNESRVHLDAIRVPFENKSALLNLAQRFVSRDH